MVETKSRWVVGSACLAAGMAIALSGASALAGPVMLSVGTSLHVGPGDEYAVLASLAPGRLNLGRCKVNGRQEHWCWAQRGGQAGWIHVQASDKLAAQNVGTPQAGTAAPQPSAGPKLKLAAGGGATFGTVGGGNSGSSDNRSAPLPTTVNVGGPDTSRDMIYRTH